MTDQDELEFSCCEVCENDLEDETVDVDGEPAHPECGGQDLRPDGGDVVDIDPTPWVEKIRGTWPDADPKVLVWRADGKHPHVVDVHGDLRLLNQGLVYARDVDVNDVRHAIERRGLPDVIPLSETSYCREEFEDTGDEGGDADAEA
jgi:hypothetical protein